MLQLKYHQTLTTTQIPKKTLIINAKSNYKQCYLGEISIEERGIFGVGNLNLVLLLIINDAQVVTPLGNLFDDNRCLTILILYLINSTFGGKPENTIANSVGVGSSTEI